MANVDYSELSNSEIKKIAKEKGIRIYCATSFGGGRSDPNRNHETWQVEVYVDDEYKSMQVETKFCSGRFDGKAACKREVKKLALIKLISENSNS